MSKKGNRFEKSSGWTSRAGEGAEKRPTGKSRRRDLSEGSQRMADGGTDAEAAGVIRKEQQRLQSRMAKADENVARRAAKQDLLRKFKKWREEGSLGEIVRCPLCGLPVNAADFERHVRKTH